LTGIESRLEIIQGGQVQIASRQFLLQRKMEVMSVVFVEIPTSFKSPGQDETFFDFFSLFDPAIESAW
jgi:hypothetical protein